MEFHPVANIFPLMEGADFDALVNDIATHGQREAIVTYEDMILDGRNRYRACERIGLKPVIRAWEGGASAVEYVVSLNLHRRHLNESQKDMVAARIANMQHGGDRKSDQAANLPLDHGVSQAAAAAVVGAKERGVHSAAKVLREAEPEMVSAVEQGKLSVSVAAKLADAEPNFQRSVVDKVNAGTKPQEAIRQTKAEQITSRPITQPTGKYRVLYADPPWSYTDALTISNNGGATESYGPAVAHYPALSIAELCALPIKDLAESDAVLFLWVTSPILEEAFQVVNAWGFRYKTSFVWDKIKHNMGHYNSVRHEFLLVCTRGSCQPDVRQLFDSVVTEERTEHSVKPETFRTIIDTIYPHGARIELFARRQVPGWTTWGNEVEY
jgi:N6-adenosine-specific RNA methylase IME4/ParB-like chromosome segregation protein Spo0J